jgi:peptidoglycan transpeptidase precursor, ErfK-YbiS-YhnG family
VNATENELETPMEKTEEEAKEELKEDQNGESKEELNGELKEELEELNEADKEEQKEEIKKEPVEGTKEEQKKESIQNLLKKHKKITAVIVILLFTLLVIYFGMTRYFTNHFYFGSVINSVNVSGKTIEEAKMVMANQLLEYKLNLKERGGQIEQIKGGDLSLKYNSEEEFKNLKDSQNPYSWILGIFNLKNSKMIVKLSYDEKLLKEQIDKLSCFDDSNVIEPKNPSFQYSDNSYVIVGEVVGNKVDKDVLYPHVVEAILKGEPEIDLESAGAYLKPTYTSESEKTIEVRDILNKYVSSKINYTFGEQKESLDGSAINKWFIVDENFKVKFDENKVKDYIDALCKTYNTVGKTRSFATSSGTTVNIDGGDYGWSINEAQETQDLILVIKEGQTITKEPVYSQKALSLSYGNNDIGNTYVELDMTKQHLWFYKNGSLIVEGNVVSGNVSAGHATPEGVYGLKYKQKYAVLRGPDYAVPVTFWMPFNGGIGLHDASWRSVFGGSIYKTNGSHGCVNMPYNVAKTIFDNIDVNTPVICY